MPQQCRPHLFLATLSQGTHVSAILALLLNKGFVAGVTGDSGADVKAVVATLRAWQTRAGCCCPWHSCRCSSSCCCMPGCTSCLRGTRPLTWRAPWHACMSAACYCRYVRVCWWFGGNCCQTTQRSVTM